VPLTPFLMFTGMAEEAVRFYVSAFPDAEILELARYGSEDAGPDGGIKGITFRIAELTLRCIDSPVGHAFAFTPAVSFFYDCPDDPTLDALFDRLTDGGSVLMPPGEFAWLNDRYGVSWQLSVGPG